LLIREGIKVFDPVNKSLIAAEAGSRFTRENGKTVNCDVLDLSLAGASLRTMSRPSFGEWIKIGKTVARVTWYHEDGVGIDFRCPDLPGR